ncbi:hypothetical protein [Streptomyces sp. NPDC020362]|uniref:hypothetical protein n=1 Tax=unclassified Streptomyces TaxID=2593676 RepID=UPI0033F4FDFE
MPALIPVGRQLGHVLIDFRPHRSGRHPAGAFAHDLVDHGAGLGGAVSIHCAQYGRTFPAPLQPVLLHV